MVVADDALPLFQAPAHVPPPGEVEPSLAVAAPATSRPFRLDGTRAVVRGTDLAGVTEVIIDGVTVCGLMSGGHGIAANTLTSPGRITRERLSPEGSGSETVLVTPTLPLVAFRWTEQSAAGVASALRVTVFPSAPRVHYRSEGHVATVASGNDGRVLALVWVPDGDRPPGAAPDADRSGPGTPAPWSADVSDGTVTLRRGHSASGTLLVAFGAPAAVRTAFQGAAHLAIHEARAGSGDGPDVLALETGAPTLDDAVAWMATRLRHGILQAEGAEEGDDPKDAEDDPLAWLWAGLGAAAVGDEDAALRCARALEARHLDAGAVLAAQIALSTGATEPARAHAARLLAGPPTASAGAATPGGAEGPDPGPRPVSAPASPLERLARTRLADALRYTLPDATLAVLRAGTTTTGVAGPRSAAASDPSGSGPGGLRLPMASPRPSPDATTAAWLAQVLAGPRFDGTPAEGALTPGSIRPPASVHPGVARALSCWHALTTGEPGAWEAWRLAVAEGIVPGGGGAGAWDALDARTPPAVTGLLLAALVHGWLGVAPDAPVGRVRVAPLLPPHVTGFAVRGLPVGDSRAGLAYTRLPDAHTFVLDPERGRVPPYVVFETRVPERAGTVTIDGAPAEPTVEPGPHGSTTIRLQTPLDARRVIRIERPPPVSSEE